VIIEELQALKTHLIESCAVNCDVGERDRAPDTYPFVEIVPDGEVPVFDSSNPQLRYANMTVTLRVITSRADEMGALNVFESLCREMGSFNREKGHVIEGGFKGEYSDSRFTISGPMVLKFRVHKTGV